MATLSVPVNVYANHQILADKFTSKTHVAHLPAANPTRSFWIDTPNANPLGAEGSTGPLTTDADICIIGSGITGISAAYHLSRISSTIDKPLKVVVLEARDFCSGATGRNGGHLIPNPFMRFASLSKDYGVDHALRTLALERRTASAMVDIVHRENLDDKVDLVNGGHIDLLLTDEEADYTKADYDAAKAAGVDLDGVEWLSKKFMQETHGTPYAAVRVPGHNIWPLKFVTELYTLAKTTSSQNFSLNLHTRTPVTSIVSTNIGLKRRWSLTTPRGSITASYIIHATNAYASSLLPHLRDPSGILPVRGQVMALRASLPLNRLTRSGWGANEGFEYWFPRPVESESDKPLVILGGGREVTLGFQIGQDDDSVLDDDVGKALHEFLPGIFPGKYEVGKEPEMEWTGIMGFTRLLDPFVGPVLDSTALSKGGYEGQFIAAGYSGHGMPRAFSCAEIVVQMVVAEMTGQKWTAPAWFPEGYLTWNRASPLEL